MKPFKFIFIVLFCLVGLEAYAGMSVNVDLCLVIEQNKTLSQKDLPTTYTLAVTGERNMNQWGEGQTFSIIVPATTAASFGSKWGAAIRTSNSAYCAGQNLRLENKCGTNCSTYNNYSSIALKNSNNSRVIPFNIYLRNTTAFDFSDNPGNMWISDNGPLFNQICLENGHQCNTTLGSLGNLANYQVQRNGYYRLFLQPDSP